MSDIVGFLVFCALFFGALGVADLIVRAVLIRRGRTLAPAGGAGLG